MMTMLVYLLALAAAWGIGEIISIKTKAKVSMVLIALVLLLGATWLGLLPTDLVDQAGMGTVAIICIPLILVHMGSSLTVKQLKQEWKTVVICLGGLVTLLLGIFTILTLAIGRDYALVGGTVVYGGSVANIIIAEKVEAIGRLDLNSFNWLLSEAQVLFGAPVALFFLKLFLKGKVKNGQIQEIAEMLPADQDIDGKEKASILPEKYQTTFILFMLCAAIGVVAYFIGGYTNKYIYLHPYIVCVTCGFLAVRFRIIPKNFMQKANVYGFLCFALYAYIAASVAASVTLETLTSQIIPLLLLFLICIPCLAVGAGITSKLLKVDPRLGIALVCSCMIGFPTTMILAEEASRSIARTPEEQEVFSKFLVPKMLLAGLFTVSMASGVLASILMNFL